MDISHRGCWEASGTMKASYWCGTWNSSCLMYEACVCQVDSSGLILTSVPLSCNFYHSRGCVFHILYFSVVCFSCSVPTFQGLQEDILSKLADVLEEVKGLYLKQKNPCDICSITSLAFT